LLVCWWLWVVGEEDLEQVVLLIARVTTATL
jgi:hypothetical protein